VYCLPDVSAATMSACEAIVTNDDDRLVAGHAAVKSLNATNRIERGDWI
jgi:hypothetical protein